MNVAAVQTQAQQLRAWHLHNSHIRIQQQLYNVREGARKICRVIRNGILIQDAMRHKHDSFASRVGKHDTSHCGTRVFSTGGGM
jgi:hypothetical protein